VAVGQDGDGLPHALLDGRFVDPGLFRVEVGIAGADAGAAEVRGGDEVVEVQLAHDALDAAADLG
jgi:hypothetical protein